MSHPHYTDSALVCKNGTSAQHSRMLEKPEIETCDWKIIDLLNSPMAFQHCILVCMGE